ncbi:IMS domain-containing protein [Synechococcus sp. MIT S1220]|uniref:IMS domain-containing protein n=1 Tax=Synechococcus sp. MIT S1220 TaxID=3082549 RepID=UPI0039AEA410
MDLPIDHFRLLGVSPSAEADTVLRKLQSRCDSPPDQGFTHEVLLQRAELLRRSADLLTDPVRRADYEAALLDLSSNNPNDTVGLELAASSEAAGLILLWEANSALEAFQMARQGLQPPQAPALGSGREADLTLLAALACRDAAVEEQDQRRYESAAQLLRDGIELQQRMGKLPDQQRNLERELERLLPYRILDLLSRDLGDQTSHQQGLQLLKQLVDNRGGLEGSGDPMASAGGLVQEDFEPFFKQIRRFLTVQEQVDLFSSWHDQGSVEAGCLAVFALAAVGFSRRKPEHLEQARDKLNGLTNPDLDPMPLLGCLDLLLGNVAAASAHFLATRDSELKTWFAEHPGDQLAAECEYCRAWLERDVLPGYRDVEASDVDLDAWFADRDVQAYVDRLDRQSGRRSLVSEPSPGEWSESWSLDPVELSSSGAEKAQELEISDSDEEERPHIDVPRNVVVGAAAGVVVLGALAFALMNWRSRAPVPATAVKEVEIEAIATQSPVDESQPQAKLKPEPGRELALKPLTADQPSDVQLQALIQAWLDRKAAVLAGDPLQTADLPSVARQRLVNRVLDERTLDASFDHSKVINASVTAVETVSTKPQRIEVRAQVAYSDQTNDASGQTVRSTAPESLTIRYIFGRDGAQWKLHEYIPES